MNDTLQIGILKEYATHYTIDTEDCETLSDYQKTIQNAIETDETIDPQTELEIQLTTTVSVGISAETLTWSEWPNAATTDITREIADDGFERTATIVDGEIAEIFDWD